jgi:PAS domain S-box-containing protein
MDGFELCRKWKHDGQLREIPFMFYTATYTDPKDEEYAMGLGADRFIVKPQEPEVILGIMEEIFAEQNAGRTPASGKPQHEESGYVKEYNEVLIRKLENKMMQVDDAKRRLEREIEERIRTEETLRLANERFQRLIESNIVGIVIANAAGNIIEANDYYLRMIGYSREELAGGKVDWRAITPSEWLPADEKGIRELRERGACTPYEKENVRRDGSLVSVMLAVAMLPGPKEEIVAVAVDITERKRAETERKRLTAAIEQTNEIVFVTDSEGTIQYVNPAFEAVTGYTREEAVGRTPRMLKSGKQDAAFYRELWETISSGKTWSGRIVNKRKDGKLYTEEATISPVRGASGKIVNYVAVKRDITENLRLSAQILQTQRIESLGTLAGGIAHDFNNILTAIIGYGEMLKLRIAHDPKAASDLNEILRNAERASVLTRQILTFARRQIIEIGNLDLNRVVTDLERLLRKVMREDIEIRIHLADGVPTIRADQGQVEQVLMNLSLNARDAMPGVGQLVVETEEAWLDEEHVKQYPYMKPGRYAVLSVNDTGIGMDEETKERIFEPFFTTKGPDKGTGLGLAVVYGIVKQHNGFIHVYSEPGKGTTFRVYFPAVDLPPDSKTAAARGVIRGGSETILVVEDDESVRHLTEKTLSSYGYKILIAFDGEEAVEVFRRRGKEIAMVMLDVVMPKKGGKQAYDEMRTMTPGLKALFVSGYSADAIHDAFVLQAGIPFLQKPFSPGALARKVREILDGAS